LWQLSQYETHHKFEWPRRRRQQRQRWRRQRRNSRVASWQGWKKAAAIRSVPNAWQHKLDHVRINQIIIIIICIIPTPRLKYKTVFQCDRCLVTSDKEQSRLRCPCHAERFQKWRTYFWPFRNGRHRGTVRALHLPLGEYYDTVDCTRLYDHFYWLHTKHGCPSTLTKHIFSCTAILYVIIRIRILIH